MTAKMIFEETYTLLNAIGAVQTKKEFYRDWLNRGESYFRCLKHSQKPPSVSVIAVCSSKLKHYSRALKRKADRESLSLAADFMLLSERLDGAMYQQTKHVWMTQMAKQQ